MNVNNIQGLKKTPRVEGPSNSEQFLNITGNASTGFQMGSSFGPIGMGVGAVAGAGLGLIQNQEAKKQAEMQNEFIDNSNKFADTLSERTQQRSYVSPLQARYGLRNKKGSLDVEVQKNEIKLGKDGNIKAIYKTSAKHDDTFKPKTVTSLEEGEKIIPTNTEDELKSFLRLHNKATIGNKKAKSQLKRIYEDLPTPEEAKDEQEVETYHNIKAQDGVNNSIKGFQEVRENIADRFNITPDIDLSRPATQEVPPTQEAGPEESLNWLTEKIEGDPWEYRWDQNNTVQTRKQGTDKWITPERYGKASEAVRGVFGLKPEYQIPDTTQENSQNSQNSQTVEDPLKNLNLGDFDSMNEELSKLGREESGEADIVLNENNPDEEVVQQNENFETYNNPLKYANAAYNFFRGSQNPQRQNRRYDIADPMKYRDTSGQARQDVRLSTRQMAESLRGKGLSAGQIQALSSQQAVAGNRQLSEINARESQLAYQTDRYNTQLGNQVRGANTQAARQYDMMDLQADAAKRSFTAAGFNELARHADLFEQRKYAVQKDEKAYGNEDAILKSIGSSNFKWVIDPKTNKPRYVESF